jgi:hypothetical protein
VHDCQSYGKSSEEHDLVFSNRHIDDLTTGTAKRVIHISKSGVYLPIVVSSHNGQAILADTQFHVLETKFNNIAPLVRGGTPQVGTLGQVLLACSFDRTCVYGM